jgi:hypothetical protein
VRAQRLPDTKADWKQVRPLTPRKRELFEETEFTRPVDFHSWRRAYSPALPGERFDDEAHPEAALSKLQVCLSSRPKLPSRLTNRAGFWHAT